MSYYTEGYISTIEVECNHKVESPKSFPLKEFFALQTISVTIDPTTPFKIENGTTILVFFIKQGGEGKVFLEDSFPWDGQKNHERVGKLRNSFSKFGITADPMFLAYLKQNHTKVRFELDSKCKSIKKLTII